MSLNRALQLLVPNAQDLTQCLARGRVSVWRRVRLFVPSHTPSRLPKAIRAYLQAQQEDNPSPDVMGVFGQHYVVSPVTKTCMEKFLVEFVMSRGFTDMGCLWDGPMFAFDDGLRESHGLAGSYFFFSTRMEAGSYLFLAFTIDEVMGIEARPINWGGDLFNRGYSKAKPHVYRLSPLKGILTEQQMRERFHYQHDARGRRATGMYVCAEASVVDG